MAATEKALAPGAHGDERSMLEAIRPAMAALLADDEPIPRDAYLSLEGAAVGNLLHADAEGRFHVLAVVFPEGTSSGIHHHGCWGLIGYLQGSDEETRYGRVGAEDADRGDAVELVEASRHVWRRGDITELLPPTDGWHRVRSAGPGDGVSVHVLCRTPSDHPHHFWDRTTKRLHPFPFIEAAPGRFRAEVDFGIATDG